jgi:hypothetical protein
MHKILPHLISFERQTYMTVERVVNTEYLEDLFHLPLSQQAYEEFQILEEVCQNAMRVIQGGNQDSWT